MTLINPQAYYRVLLIMIGKETVCIAFTIGGFLAENSGKIGNAALQYGVFAGSQALGKSVDIGSLTSITSIALPAITNTRLIQEYINCPGTPQSPEMKALTIGLLYVLGGLFTVGADAPTNLSIATVMAAYSQYMGFAMSNAGNTPFLYLKPKRVNYTFKQHLLFQAILPVGLIVISGFGVLIVYTSKKLVRKLK